MICELCLKKFKKYLNDLILLESRYVSETYILMHIGTDEELNGNPWLHCHCLDDKKITPDDWKTKKCMGNEWGIN